MLSLFSRATNTVAAQRRILTSLPEFTKYSKEFLDELSRIATSNILSVLAGKTGSTVETAPQHIVCRVIKCVACFLRTLQANICSLILLYTNTMDQRYKRQLQRFYETRRRMPSYAEIMELTGFSSRSSVFKLVRRLAENGFLIKDKRGKLAPGNIWGTLSILGTVEAGFPSPAEEDRGEGMSLDEYLMPRRDASYMLKVKGDSMKDAGIIEGDMVIVERRSDAKVGDIVIAEIDGAWTMKYYRMKAGRPYLEAANAKYKDIHPEGELRVAAVVSSVVRKY